MQILLTAATPFEIAPVLQWLESNFARNESGVFEKEHLAVFPLITGVGVACTCWRLGQFFAQNKPGIALNAGVAGAFNRRFRIGDVFHVTTERFGDLGVEEADGSFTDLFELGLTDAGAFPFAGGVLKNDSAMQSDFLPVANGLTVNKVHGSGASIDMIRAKYPDAQLESMEGAAFFFSCLHAGIPFLEIRAISNYVEPRNREAWNLPLAIANLNETLREIIGSF